MVLKELSRALGRLPTDQREALFMVVLQGMSYEEVAEATGCAVGHGEEPRVPRPAPVAGLAGRRGAARGGAGQARSIRRPAPRRSTSA